MEKLLSIVIPVYKVEKYIIQCLDSLIVPDKDMFERLEVVIVNDGTPDNSANMAREYQKRFPTVFHVFDKENGGHGSAFNAGLSKATGKYLRFLDSDDWFDTNNLLRLMNFLDTSDVDLVLNPFNYYLVEKNKFDIIPLLSMKFDHEYKVEEYDFFNSGNRHNMTVFHSATYKTILLKPYLPLFAEGCYYDDMALRIAPLSVSTNFIAFNYPIYNYRVGREGQTITYENKIKHAADLNKVYQNIVKFMKKRALTQSNKQQYIRHLWSCMVYYQVEKISRMQYKDSKRILADLQQVLRDAEGTYDKRIRQRLYEQLPFPCFYWLYKIYDKLFFADQLKKV